MTMSKEEIADLNRKLRVRFTNDNVDVFMAHAKGMMMEKMYSAIKDTEDRRFASGMFAMAIYLLRGGE